MGVEQVTLGMTATTLLISIYALFVAMRVEKKMERQANQKTFYEAMKPKEQKVLVPGKGFFSTPKEKRMPKYYSDSELWVKEQDEKR